MKTGDRVEIQPYPGIWEITEMLDPRRLKVRRVDDPNANPGEFFCDMSNSGWLLTPVCVAPHPDYPDPANVGAMEIKPRSSQGCSVPEAIISHDAIPKAPHDQTSVDGDAPKMAVKTEILPV